METEKKIWNVLIHIFKVAGFFTKVCNKSKQIDFSKIYFVIICVFNFHIVHCQCQKFHELSSKGGSKEIFNRTLIRRCDPSCSNLSKLLIRRASTQYRCKFDVAAV